MYGIRPWLFVFLLVFFTGYLCAQSLPLITARQAGMDGTKLERIDRVIEKAIEKKQIPGAVLLVMRDNRIVYRKAFGFKQIYPVKKPMSVETVFDLASLTKPIATATSLMILLEQGQIRLLDEVKLYIPTFTAWIDDSTKEKTHVRIIHLLTHTSGLPPYAPVDKLKKQFGSPAADSLIHYIATVKRHHAPGAYFKYSCLNFITLQHIIEQISGQTLQDFSYKNIFKPLNMRHTGYKPSQASSCAPTELLDDGTLLQGTVHDPLARVMMGCISGNAGLFSTADDLALFSAMMLNNGYLNDTRILSPASVHTMVSVPANYEKFGRGLGWDLNSAYSSNQGDLFGSQTYGHTGYTGTSLIIDPETRTSLIFLTNRVHPNDKGSVVRLRSLVANMVAAAIVK
ncbi:MAG TPA: hypothetical protein EYP36_00860 [Calditrichaeota bacterium]|nr:hypothetical protein [Calditrichota bacterium]